jgi:hypothetical protein
MTLPLIGVGLSYVVLAVLLLSLNLASRWHWGVKATAITVTTLFFGVSYASIAGLVGWPSEARVPEHFQLDWATVVEPDKLNGSPGSIYLWIEALDENNASPAPFACPTAATSRTGSGTLKSGSSRAWTRLARLANTACRKVRRTRTSGSRVSHGVKTTRAARGTRLRSSSICQPSSSRTCRHRSYIRSDRCETRRIC